MKTFNLSLLKLTLILVIVACVFYYLGSTLGDPNRKFVYGDTGLPKNCRAIISENIEAYRSELYPAEDIIESIDRNCGAFGYSWGK
jgi:hypothetical protein